MHTPRDRLEAALQYLLQLIDEGVEYPDAEWKATQRHNIPADTLRQAYDDNCMESGNAG